MNEIYIIIAITGIINTVAFTYIFIKKRDIDRRTELVLSKSRLNKAEERALYLREQKLEVYAAQIDDWDRKIRIKKTAVDGVLTFARRLAEKVPEVRERMDVLEAELFGDK